MADDDAEEAAPAPTEDRLPDSTDPFVLLGVARETADERALRTAYATLTRRFRPEQAPEEFARLHDAFARAREMLQFEMARRRADAERNGAPDEPPPPEAPPEDVLDDEHAQLLVRAAEADGPVRDALVGELLASNAFVAAVRRAPHLRDAVLGSPAIRWSGLGDASDRYAAIALWRAAWDRAYLAGDLVRTEAMLEDARLAVDAVTDLDLARAALDRVVGLAWKREVPEELVDRLRAATEAHWESVDYLARFDNELALAMKVKARPLPDVLAPLPAFLVAGRLRDFENRRRFATDLRRRLGADPPAAVAAIGAYRKQEPHVVRAMIDVLAPYLPDMRTRLEMLPRARFEALTQGLVAAGTAPVLWPRIVAIVGAVGVAGFVVGVAGAVGAGIAAIAAGLVHERRRYRRDIRPRVARVLHAVPVRVGVVSRWIAANTRLAGQLGWYDLALEADPELDLYSLVVSASAEEAGVAERDVFE